MEKGPMEAQVSRVIVQPELATGTHTYWSPVAGPTAKVTSVCSLPGTWGAEQHPHSSGGFSISRD